MLEQRVPLGDDSRLLGSLLGSLSGLAHQLLVFEELVHGLARFEDSDGLFTLQGQPIRRAILRLDLLLHLPDRLLSPTACLLLIECLEEGESLPSARRATHTTITNLVAGEQFTLEVSLLPHARRGEPRILDRLVDIALLVKAVLVSLDNLERVILFLLETRQACQRVILVILSHGFIGVHIRVLRLLNRLDGHLRDLMVDDEVQDAICCRYGVLLEEVDQIYGFLNHLEEAHPHYFLDRLSIEVVQEHTLDVPAGHALDLASHHVIVDKVHCGDLRGLLGQLASHAARGARLAAEVR